MRGKPSRVVFCQFVSMFVPSVVLHTFPVRQGFILSSRMLPEIGGFLPRGVSFSHALHHEVDCSLGTMQATE